MNKRLKLSLIIILSFYSFSAFAETDLSMGYFNKADSLSAEKKYNDACMHYDLALKKGFNRPVVYINYGWNLFLSGDIKKGIIISEAGLKEYPDERYLTGNLALFYFATGDEKKGEEFYNRLFSMKLGKITYWYIYKDDINAVKDRFENKDFYQKAKSYYLKKAKTIYNDFESAYNEFEKYDIEYQNAIQYMNTGVYDKAITNFQKIEIAWRKFDPSVYYADLLSNCGYIYFTHLKNPKKSLEFLNKSLSILDSLSSPEYRTRYLVLSNMASVFFDLKKYDKIISCYNKALKAAYLSAIDEIYLEKQYIELGEAYFQTGNFVKALDCYTKVLGIEINKGDTDIILNQKNNISDCHVKMENFDMAITLNLEIAESYIKSGQIDNLILTYNKIADIYESKNDFNNVILFMEKALNIIKDKKTLRDEAEQIQKIADYYSKKKMTQQAERLYHEAFGLFYSSKDQESAKKSLESIVVMYFENYDKKIFENKCRDAIEYGMVYNLDMRTTNDIISDYINRRFLIRTLSNANVGGSLKYLLDDTTDLLRISENINNLSYQVYFMNYIGKIYQLWGLYDKALSIYIKALTNAEQSDSLNDIVDTYNNLAYIYNIKGNRIKSFEYYTNAEKKIDKMAGDSIKYGWNTYIGLGDFFCENQDDRKSLEYYNKALSISDKFGTSDGVGVGLVTTDQTRAIAYNKISNIYKRKGDYLKALEYCYKAVSSGNLNERFKEEMESVDGKGILITDPFVEIDIFKNLGEIYYLSEKYDDAIKYFNINIKTIEHFRSDASGTVRREFFSRMIDTYHWLILSYYKKNDIISAFTVAEKTSARYLLDRLQEKKNYKGQAVLSNIEDYRKDMDSDTALIRYICTDNDNIIVFVATKEMLKSFIIKKSDFIGACKNNYDKSVISDDYISKRGMIIDQAESLNKNFTFENIIEYYRWTLSNPKNNEYNRISSDLFQFLFKEVENRIPGKKHLCIIPDGILGLIPFETLISGNNRYLIEKYDIFYIQSLTVADLVNKRKFSSERRSMLAFGGAVYDDSTWNQNVNNSEYQVAHIQNEVSENLNRGRGLRSVYSELGYIKWSNLPGTLAEINKIKRLYPDAKIFTGKDVNEAIIKEMSARGELKLYQVLHFATHGIVIPQIPELSAIVLSQNNKVNDNQDGYLSMNKIEELDIGADFVNLSACETGLGKVYSGEGVVGLTQSFFIAGANSVSVSLWSVSDESTMEFMSGMYSMICNKKISYAAANNEMKRNFLSGSNKDYRHPYYWAPFVYYGDWK